MKYLIFLFSCFLSFQAFAVETPISVKEYLGITEKIGVYQVHGKVIGRSICPPCLTPGTCAPCPNDSITVMDTVDETMQLSMDTRIADQFEVGGKYIFTLYNGEQLRFIKKELSENEKKTKVYSVKEYKNQKHKPDWYSVKGYVVHKYICPPCPEGAMCGPCAPESVFLSDFKEKQECGGKWEMCAGEQYFELNHPEAFADGVRHKAEDIELGELYYFLLMHTRKLDGYKTYSYYEGELAAQEMLKNDPELLKKNPIKWIEKYYDLKDPLAEGLKVESDGN
jgi:ribosomal protein S27AE